MCGGGDNAKGAKRDLQRLKSLLETPSPVKG